MMTDNIPYTLNVTMVYAMRIIESVYSETNLLYKH